VIAGNVAGALLTGNEPENARGRLAVSVYQAFSQGHVRITSTDPDADPEIEENMLSHPADLARLRDGVRRLEALAVTPAFQAITDRVDYGTTGRPMTDRMSDAELDHFLLAECSDAQHASGTCRMGDPTDPRSVVDTECRVLGTTGLRVIDASIMPEVPRANTHLSTVAIAEKMAAQLVGA
jgi:choline dehydrogenase